MSASLIRVPMNDPSDVPDVTGLLADGAGRENVRAVIVKSEGNGCVNDFSRTLAMRCWSEQLPDAVTVVSGGTEGVLSPHATLILDVPPGQGMAGGLVVGVDETPALDWAEIGTETHAFEVAASVRRIEERLRVSGDDVVFALVKCPLLTKNRMESVRASSKKLLTEDSYESMAFSRAASAAGVGYALGELDDHDLASALNGNQDVWSAVASASAGAELDRCKVVVLAQSSLTSGPLRATNVVMKDALDFGGVLGAIEDVRRNGGVVCQLFAKADPDPSGAIRGLRHTMLTDSDLNATRHARAAVGGLLAAFAGRSDIYVSGGAENQGPPGGGPVTIVWEPAGAHFDGTL